MRPKHACGLDRGAPGWGRTREEGSQRPHGLAPVIGPSNREDIPGADLGKVVRGLFFPDGDPVAHAAEIVAHGLNPLGVLEEVQKGQTHSRAMNLGRSTQHM